MDTAVYRYIEACLKTDLGNNLELLKINALSGGCINAASALETNQGVFFAKWNKSAPSDIFLREAEGLQELAKAETELVIPEVILAKEALNQYPGFLITEYLDPAIKHEGQDEKLGEGLAQLHRFETEKFGFRSDTYCGATHQNNSLEEEWVTFYSENRINHLLKLIQSKRAWTSQQQKIFTKLLDKLPQVIGHKPQPALNHGDLWSGNYLFTAKGPAIIDPAVTYADRELDLALTTMFGGFSDRFWQAYQSNYPLAAEWEDRNPVYMLYHYLNHYYLFGGGYGAQALQIAKNYL